jgi:hypothetical protein
MPDNIFDIYIAGFFILLFFAALHFKQASAMHSQGKKLMGFASLLISFSLLLIKFGIPLYYFFIVLAFILSVIGYGILMTKEKEIYEQYWKQHGLYGRLSRLFSRKEVQDIGESNKEQGRKSHAAHSRLVIPTSITIMVAAVLIFFWRHEIIYPILLVSSGIFYIVMDRCGR